MNDYGIWATYLFVFDGKEINIVAKDFESAMEKLNKKRKQTYNFKAEKENIMLIKNENLKCKSEKSREFEVIISKNHTNINSFIELFNCWIDMNIDERSECVDKLSKQNQELIQKGDLEND